MTFIASLKPNLGTISRKANYQSGERDKHLKSSDVLRLWAAGHK